MKTSKAYISIILIALISIFSGSHAYAQNKKVKKIELKGANKFKEGDFHYKGHKIAKLIGNVRFEHEGVNMRCDSAYFDNKKNSLFAFSNVIINQGDSLTLYGDSLDYFGDIKLAQVKGNVKLVDNSMTLTTKHLDYDLKNKLAYYYDGGHIVNNKNNLTSKYGAYNTTFKTYYFKNDVILKNDNYLTLADTLNYNTASEIIYFLGPTTITGPNKYIYAEDGEYHTLTERSYININAEVRTDEYILKGDSLYYDNVKDNGYAFQNVSLESIKDSSTLYGNEVHYGGKKGKSIVNGQAYFKRYMLADSVFLSADTLISFDDDTLHYLHAFNNVKIFKRDFQGVCDSLVYDIKDSTIRFFYNPIVWNSKNQITADTLIILLKAGKIDRMFANTNAFISSEDTIKNYNQVKGRNMVAYFLNDELNKVDVNGNGQSVYFALEEKVELVGLNNVICSNMIIRFLENEVDNITFLTKPAANFIPPQLIQAPDTRMPGFSWEINKKPTYQDFKQ